MELSLRWRKEKEKEKRIVAVIEEYTITSYFDQPDQLRLFPRPIGFRLEKWELYIMNIAPTTTVPCI